jgi:glucose/arabinose dehydrogenase
MQPSARPFAGRRLFLLALGLAGGVAGALGAGDAAEGRVYFQQSCAICHATTLGPGNAPFAGQGPSLVGVVGRRAASVPNFNYTRALSASGITWDPESLDRFLSGPITDVPGTNMVVTVPGAADRRNLIAFLQALPAGQAAATEPIASPAPALTAVGDPGDWRNDAPGVWHAVRLAAMPAPFSTVSAGNGPKVVERPEGASLSVLPGFTVRLFASGLTGPRLLRTAPNGDIFIAETRAGRVRVLRAADGASSPSDNEIFADNLEAPFGINFYPAGGDPKWVYVATLNSVIRYPYQSGDLRARGAAETVVPRLSGTTGGHTTRDIAFSLDGRRMFIQVGSGSNVAEGLSVKSPAEIGEWEAGHGLGAAWGAETNRADMLVTDPEGRQPLRTFATGIRNGAGIAVDPETGELWSSTNERDLLGDDLVPDYVTRVREGGFYGWPWWYMGGHEDPRHAGERPDLAHKTIDPDVPLQSHSAPLEMVFYTATSGVSAFPAEYRGDIFVASHGSWNRNTRTGYKVIRIPRKGGVALGVYEDFMTGFVVDGRSVWGRPVGVAVARDGALLVTEDGNDTLWRISYSGAGP